MATETKKSEKELEPQEHPHGVDDFSIEFLDGARALLRLGKEVRYVDQADLHRVAKQVAAGIQNTY